MFAVSKDDSVHNLKQNNTKPSVLEMAGNAGRKVRDALHSANNEFSHANDAVKTEIRTNPLRSSLIALSVGFVLGGLFRR
jgi:hypothetical protein